MRDNFFSVGKSVEKIDSLSLAVGEDKFTDDFHVENPLYISFLYSPHAHALIKNIDTSEALKVPGVVDIISHKNAPMTLHTTAGQSYPEPSPYDTRLFDRKVRYVGDRVALAAAETLEAAEEAVKKIKVEYKVLEPLFDIEKSMDTSSPTVHEDDEHVAIPVPYQPEINLAGKLEFNIGDLEKGFREADFIEERTYRTQIASHCAIEPHAVIVMFDPRGRLVIISTTQVPFHVRRITGRVLDIPIRMIRVVKPRLGGGFGGKQEVIFEPFAALVAWRNKRSVRFVASRREVFVSGRTRHASRIRLKTGAKKDGEITAIEMDCLLNAGAYGTHSLTVLSSAGAKVLPLFNKIENLGFQGNAVYTNLPIGGAYRGYGATQGTFALNQHLDIIARRTNQDILSYIKKWHIREGETSEVFKALGEGKEGVGQIIGSCKLDECIDRGAEAIEWYEKRSKRIKVGEHRIKGLGMAISMQGSGLPKLDLTAASMKMNEDGSFNLNVGATDIGTGSDTILAQIAGEVLKLPIEKIIVFSSDTDLTPFDVGAYASSTTYISGTAVMRCAQGIAEQLKLAASEMLGAGKERLDIDTEKVVDTETGKSVSYEEIGYYTFYTKNRLQIQAGTSYESEVSPPPFIAQFAEVDVDLQTGRVEPVKFVSCIDCGTAVNPSLVEGQVEGAAVNGISYALCEEYLFGKNGRMLNADFWDYKIYTACDIPDLKTIIVGSYEETGPFGAKSVGEIAINGPAPAIANAIYDAVGVRMYELPMTPFRVYTRMKEEASA
jgi:putative selenate reductase molybdopterin-binding subunit